MIANGTAVLYFLVVISKNRQAQISVAMTFANGDTYDLTKGCFKTEKDSTKSSIR